MISCSSRLGLISMWCTCKIPRKILICSHVVQWQAISLNQSALMAGTQHGQRPLFVVIPTAHNSDKAWYTDVSSDVAQRTKAAL